DILPPVGVVESDLDCAYAAVADGGDPRDALIGRHELSARGVREQALGTTAEESPAGGPERAADEIEDSSLDRPWPSVVQVDRLAELAHQLRPQRVDADEQMLEQLAVGERVAARVALEPVVAAHDHDRRCLGGSGHGIPRHPQRRVEWEDVATRL